MKSLKNSVIIILLSLFFNLAYSDLKAQSNWEAGIRFGDRWSADLTIPLKGGGPRIHPAVYFDTFGIGAYFDWLFGLSDGPSGLKFYPGIGPEIYFPKNDVRVNIVGNFGVEYSFNFPLTIGFDWRPGFQLTNDFKWTDSNWGFMARFRIGEGSKFVRTN
jgi:hypothetical protein